MKRWAVLILTICLLFLSACGNGEQKAFANFAAEVAKAEEIDFNAKLRAEYSNITAEFELKFHENSEEATVEILKPEILSGIKAHISEDSAELEYDGAILDLGMLSDDLNPMSALSVLRKAITDGHVDLAWEEDGMLCVRLVPEDDTVVKLWLDTETMTPLNAEITCDSNTTVFIEIEDWTMK